jgi:hypothetical protein
MTTTRTLDRRALNRATLARQLLLHRHDLSVEDALAHLYGMQCQAPLAPFVSLAARLDGFDPAGLSALLAERRAVRMHLMRCTIHLVTADDALAVRPVMQPVLERGFRGSPFLRELRGLDPAEVAEAARATVDAAPPEEPVGRAGVGAELARRWPDHDAGSLTFAAVFLLPLVQLPPRGLWGTTAPVRWANLNTWLGRPMTAPDVDSVVRRYLAAYGPATVADVQAWSGLTGLREVADRLRPELVTFRDEAGRELFDLPDAPRPDPGTPAPVRFLGEYDNLLLSFADRSRVIPDRRRVRLFPGNGARYGFLLVDGDYAADWRLDLKANPATLVVEPFRELAPAECDEVEAEAAGLLALIAGDPAGERAGDRPGIRVRIAPAI